eukprot:3857870-Rhodomonas_salina.1
MACQPAQEYTDELEREVYAMCARAAETICSLLAFGGRESGARGSAPRARVRAHLLVGVHTVPDAVFRRHLAPGGRAQLGGGWYFAEPAAAVQGGGHLRQSFAAALGHGLLAAERVPPRVRVHGALAGGVPGVLGRALPGHERAAVRGRGEPAHGARALGLPHAADDGEPVHAAAKRDVAGRHCARGAFFYCERALDVHLRGGPPHVRARARRAAAAAALHGAALHARRGGRLSAPACAGLLRVGVRAALGGGGRLDVLPRGGWRREGEEG